MDQKVLWPLESFDDICMEYAGISGGTSEVLHDDALNLDICKRYRAAGDWYGRTFFLPLPKEQQAAAFQFYAEQYQNDLPSMACFLEEEQAEGMEDALKKMGYKYLLTQTGMFFDLTGDVPEEICPDIVTIDTACVSNPEYQTIRQQAIPADRLHEWTEVMTEGFAPEKQLDYVIYDYMQNSENQIFYAFLEDGKIAGTSMILLRENNSGIHEVGVPPIYRHKKIATRLIIRILQDLKKLGRTEVSLQASPFGYHVYKGIGFEETGKIQSWFYKQ